MVAERVRIATGRTVIVENRPGGGGRVAGEVVARAEPDGGTILFAPIVTTAFTPFVVKNLSFDPLNDLAPITRLGNFKFTLALNLEVPASTVREFVGYVKANPGRSATPPPARARRRTFSVRCSTARPAPTSCTCRIAAGGPAALAVNRRSGCNRPSTPRWRCCLLQGRQGQAPGGHRRRARAGHAGGADLRRVKIDLGDIEDAEMWNGFCAGQDRAGHGARAQRPAGRGARRPQRREMLRSLDVEVATSTPEEFARLIKADYERWGAVIRSTGFTLSEELE